MNLEERIKKIEERNKRVGFALSTLSLGIVRKIWEKQI